MEDVAKVKIKNLIGALTTPQIWGVGAAVLGLLGAAFAIGFSAAIYKSDVQAERNNALHQIEMEKLRNKHFIEITKLKLRVKSIY